MKNANEVKYKTNTYAGTYITNIDNVMGNSGRKNYQK